MSYRNILLHLDSLAACRHRVALALDLGERFGARITGVAPTGTLAMPYAMEVAPPGELMAEWQETLQRQARKAADAFEASARQAGFVRVETRVAEGGDIPAITQAARYADLVVIGQDDPADRAIDQGEMSAGEVVLGCARPVLVVPYIGAAAGFGKHVLVAWNGSREASRAVTDALPLLKRAQRVTVMAVNPQIDLRGHGQLPGADLATFLAQHEFRVEVQADRGAQTNVGEDLLSRIADLDIDLLVMGAYGHSRAREWAFGGVTRTILQSMTVPVLMSH